MPPRSGKDRRGTRMRDDDYDDYHAAADGAPSPWRARFMARLSVGAGALLAVGIVAGASLWVYRLVGRDVTAIPVIHAALAPAKVQPDDPGGAVTAHQDMTSYEAGANSSRSPQITFAPPPERPVAEDVAMGTLGQKVASVPAVSDAVPGTGDVSAAAGGTALAPAESPVAPVRPADLSQQMAKAEQAASQEAKLAASAASSTVQIQLGAFESRDETEAQWDRIFRPNQDVLGGRTLVVQSTISGGRRFFRLRAGPFRDRTEAQNVCRALQARGQDCLVAVNG